MTTKLTQKAPSFSNALSARKLGGEASTFLAGSVFTLLVGFPLQIFVARSLGATDLGIFGLYEAAMMSAADLLSLGIASVLVRFIPQYLEQKRYGELRRLLTVSLKLVALMGLAGLAGAVLIGLLWWDRMGLAASHRPTYFLATAIIPLTLVTFALSQALRGFMEVRHIVLGQSILQLVLKAAIAVVLLTAGFGISGYVVAVVAANVFAILWLSWGLTKRMRALPPLQPEGASIAEKDWIAFASYNYVSVVLGAFTARLDRFVLGYFATAASVGIAIAVVALNNLPSIFLRVLLAVASPMFTQMQSNGDRAGVIYLYQVTTDWVMRAILPFAIFLIAFARALLDLYGGGFSEAGATALILLACGQLINSAAGPAGALLNATGKERAVFVMMLLATAANALGLFVLVPVYGLMGWAVVNLAVNILHAAMAIYVLGAIFEVAWWTPRYAKWLAPAAGSALIATALAMLWSPAGVIELMLCLGLCYATFLLLMLVMGLNAEDRELARDLWQRLWPHRTGTA